MAFSIERKIGEEPLAPLPVDDHFLHIREDLLQRFDIDPLADDVGGLLVFFHEFIKYR